tara:strand:- start:396 stop:521 length:126 start_codon:yes stop_codon:yes gene_type:complete
MTNFYTESSSISPFEAILWCFYPMAVVVLFALLTGGGFEDE